MLCWAVRHGGLRISEWTNGIGMLDRRIAPMRELERRFHLEGEQKLEWRCQGLMRKEVWRRKVLVYAILRLTPNPAGRSATCNDMYSALYLCDWQPQCLLSYKHHYRQRSVLYNTLSACQTQLQNEIVSLSCMYALSLCCFDCLLSMEDMVLCLLSHEQWTCCCTLLHACPCIQLALTAQFCSITHVSCLGMYDEEDEQVHTAISKLEIVRTDKELLGKLKIKKEKMSIAQLQQYLVDKAKADNKNKAKAEQIGCEQFETGVFGWKPLRR